MFLNIFSITVILNLEPKIISINENPQSDIKYQCYSSHFPNGFLHYTQMYFFLDLLLRFLEIFCTISFRSIQYSIAFIARHVLVIFFEYISSIISCRHYVWFSQFWCHFWNQRTEFYNQLVLVYNPIGSSPKYDNFRALAEANPPI